ncbi:myb family transcription factor PHL7-like isoform X3 [Musa acuminata AAA Group]
MAKALSKLVALEFRVDQVSIIQSTQEEAENNACGGLRIFMTALLMQSLNLVDQIVGATPKGVLRVMAVPGITIYHVKSHLQKYRLAKYLPDSPADGSKDDKKDSGHTHSDTDSAPSAQFNESLKMQMEVQKRLHEQLEVQRQLQLRIEAQGRYLQKIIEEQQKLSGVVQKHKSSLSLPISDSNRNPSPLKKPRTAVVNQSSDAAQETPKQESKPDLCSDHCIISCGFGAGTMLDEGTGSTQQNLPNEVEVGTEELGVHNCSVVNL